MSKAIQERGKRLNKLDCGWRLPNEILAPIIITLEAWEPITDVERRDKHICELAFLHDMNAQQITRLNDPIIVGMGNRSKGKPLSASSILDICYKHFPELKDRPRKITPKYEERKYVIAAQKKGEIDKPRICATCGSTSDLELHHIIPLSQGGTNDYFNLVYLCRDCHKLLHHQIYDWLSNRT